VKLLEILRFRLILDCLDLRLVFLNSSMMKDETQELSRSDTKCAPEWIHLRLASIIAAERLDEDLVCDLPSFWTWPPNH